jgi:hypothetical protein
MTNSISARPASLILGLPLAVAFSSTACSSTSGGESHPELVASQSQAISAPALGAPTIDQRASLFITDTAIVSQFSLQAVLQQLATQAADAGIVPTTPLALFQQIFASEAPPECTPDAGNTAAGQFIGPNGPDGGFASAGAINGWPAQCPREESAEARNNPFIPEDGGSTDNEYMATTLSNRFDLASPDSSDCGEYRINFARRSGADPDASPPEQEARVFIAFEARVPNPNPSAGLQGCKPIEAFWANLTGKTESARASDLLSFYFQGLPDAGVGPVISIENYGAPRPPGKPLSGQVRINQFFFPKDFIFQDWSPREFLLEKDCDAGPCALKFIPSFDKNVPSATLFDPTSTTTSAKQFQAYFVDQVGRLALNDPNAMNYVTPVPAPYNIGDDQIINSHTDYTQAFDGDASLDGGPSADGKAPIDGGFAGAIQGQLDSFDSKLTPQQIVARAMSLSCAGCHLKSLSDTAAPAASDLGGGVVLPAPVNNFVQVAETTELIPDSGTPDASRFVANPVVTQVFLPYRAQIMTDFLSSVPGFERDGAWTSAQAAVSLVSSPVTQGSQALSFKPTNGWTEIDSTTFSSVGLPPIETLLVDVRLPTSQPDAGFHSELSATFTIPSAGVNGVVVGPVPLTGLPLGAYTTVSLRLPATLQRVLGYGVNDINIALVLDVPVSSSTYYLDNLRFH